LRIDTIFYQLFQTFPSLLVELLGEDAATIASYQFTSVEVKEKAFRFDGVFLPQTDRSNIWFVEVQFQKVNEFYSQLHRDISLFTTVPTRAGLGSAGAVSRPSDRTSHRQAVSRIAGTGESDLPRRTRSGHIGIIGIGKAGRSS
jgi:hypothetical protein